MRVAIAVGLSTRATGWSVNRALRGFGTALVLVGGDDVDAVDAVDDEEGSRADRARLPSELHAARMRIARQQTVRSRRTASRYRARFGSPGHLRFEP